jgi:hypothetical protein
MNAWAKTANVEFTENTDPQLRIARADTPPEIAGYWSYLGTDTLSIPANQATMKLESFSMNIPESEFHRVVRHETGYTLGFPHDHMRRELVKKIDQTKAIKFFGATQDWTPDEVRQQVLAGCTGPPLPRSGASNAIEPVRLRLLGREKASARLPAWDGSSRGQ